ncbi:MAG: serine/threonine-protein kinase [Sandaracinus sp.]
MPNDERPPGAPPRFSREPTDAELAAARRSLEPESGGSAEFNRVEGEEDLHEVQPDLPDLRAELDEAERGGRYQDGPILGAGGMGEVRLRKDRRIGRSIAAKIMHSHVETAETRQRFLREGRVQGQLEHPAIVPVYDMGVDENGRLFFTMKRVRGQTLARILFGLASADEEYTKRFTRRRILAAFLQVCRAVHYAHVHGVLHRDLKPSNVMIGDYGEVYVLDWGLARSLELRPEKTGAADKARHSIVAADPTRLRMYKPNITKPGNLIGTLAYMSPEQARTEPLDARADVYSLGVILFEILALRRFRDDSSYLRVIAMIVDGIVARPSDHVDVDPRLDEICVKATAVEREDRYDTALEVAEEIERWLDGARDAESQKRSAAAAVKGAKERLASADPEASGAALHDLLRAVTLDPDNREAPKLLVEALEAPGAALPKEVDAEVAARRAARPNVGAFISVAAVLTLAMAPLLWVFGVQHLGVLGPVLALSIVTLGLLLYARSVHAAQQIKLDENDRRLAVQAYHLRRLFPGAIDEGKRDRMSNG